MFKHKGKFIRIKKESKIKAAPEITGVVKVNDVMLWRVNTVGMLNECLEHNPGMSIMKVPFKIFGEILFELGQRAAELNDPKLNALMCRLSIYEIADPYHSNYNPELVKKLINDAYKKEVSNG